jgi:hypothetical protein
VSVSSTGRNIKTVLMLLKIALSKLLSMQLVI